MAGIRITLVEDVSSVIRSSQDVDRALERNADSLDDLAREAQQAGREAGRDLSTGVERGTDDATDSVERLERSFRDMARDVSRSTRNVGDDLDTSVRQGTDDAADSVQEFRDEARSNFSEVASSFTGDMSQAADGVQGILGGLAGSLPGPLGLISGLLAAVGGGFLQNWVQSTEDVKETTQDMYDDLLESGADYLSKDYQQRTYYDILQGNSKVLKLRDLEQIAAFSMQSNEAVALAYSGNVESMKQVTDGLIAKRKEFEEQLRDEDATNDSAAKSALNAIHDQIAALERRKQQIEETSSTVQRQRQYFNDMSRDAIDSAEEARARFSGLGDAISSLPRTASVKVTADTRELERELAKPRTVRVNVAPAGGMRVV